MQGSGAAASPAPTSHPAAPLLPIAGSIAFLNERVDIALDGERLERPVTRFS